MYLILVWEDEYTHIRRVNVGMTSRLYRDIQRTCKEAVQIHRGCAYMYIHTLFPKAPRRVPRQKGVALHTPQRLHRSHTPRHSLHSTCTAYTHRTTALTSLALHTPQHLHCSHTPRHSTYIARLAHSTIHHATSPFNFLLFLKPG